MKKPRLGAVFQFQNTEEPALPGLGCCPLKGGRKSDAKCAKPGGQPESKPFVRA
jgi:hypothetical protein